MRRQSSRSRHIPLENGQKQSAYFRDKEVVELKQEARRLDRSMSWLVQRAWKLARAEIRKLPAPPAIGGDHKPGGAE